MTLSEMASYICNKVNQTEPEDVADCKGFIRRRYETIWNDQLWKDSLAQINMTIDTTNADNAAGVVVLPELIDRPVALRGADRAILVNPLERYYRIDLDIFARSGAQYECALLNPAWLTVRPESNPWTEVTLNWAGGFIPVPPPTLYLGRRYRFDNTLGTYTFHIHSPDLTTNENVAPGAIGYFTATQTGSYLLNYSSPNGTTGVLSILTQLGANQSSGAGSTILISSSSAGDTSNIKVIWRDLAGKRYETTGPLPLTLTPDDDAGYFEIEAIFKPTTTGTVTVTLNDGSGLTAVLGTLAPTATRTPAYQRVRVFDMPNQSGAIKVAGKVKCDQLDFDNQEPVLRGCENILICFAQGDMLERERRYGQAQALFAEAVALLEQLKRVEVVQQAHNARIIPQFGFISEYDLYASNLLSF